MIKLVSVCREAWQILFGDDPIEKPMANFYGCRLKEPVDGANYGYEKCAGKHDGKCIDHVYMTPSGGKSVLQALRYPKKVWDRSAAKSHCSGRGGKFDV